MAYLSGACHLNHSTQLTVDEHKKREGFAMQRSQLQVDFLNHRVLILIAFHSNSKTENQFFFQLLSTKTALLCYMRFLFHESLAHLSLLLFSFVFFLFNIFITLSSFAIKQGRLPVKWTAHEALLYGTYTTQSDV